MPLVNSIVKAIIRQQNQDHLLIQDLETQDIYEYKPDGLEYPIAGEIIDVRTDRFSRNLEIGRHDILVGKTIETSLDPVNIDESPPTLKEMGEWDPDYEFGREASEALFPQFAGRTFKAFDIVPGEKLSDDNAGKLEKAREAGMAYDAQTSQRLLDEILAESPYDLESIRLRGYLCLQNRMFESAAKYFQLGINYVEKAFPEETGDVVLHGRYPGNFRYLSFLQGKGFVHEQTLQVPDALMIFRKCYRFDPFDNMGVRFSIHRLAKEDQPAMDTKAGPAIEPYLYVEKYDIPIHDKYDPAVRIKPKEWLHMSELYQQLIIMTSHTADPQFQNLGPDQLFAHVQIHMLAETALAVNSPPQIRLDLARMIALGHSRHETIHIIGQQMQKIMAESQNQAAAVKPPEPE